jgi:hypothetical protein
MEQIRDVKNKSALMETEHAGSGEGSRGTGTLMGVVGVVVYDRSAQCTQRKRPCLDVSVSIERCVLIKSETHRAEIA